ncbi:MAG: nucleoside triphosphate pyrophosphohydrolase [Thermodesulfobacteriota bacterium]|nr:nucleoside triphosphate pyrophosphohydrolase [Thermodesulfobacteriota bacterium]
MAITAETGTQFTQLERLTHIIETLRSENGCPWDRKQTPRSMIIYLIEEMYELADAIELADDSETCEELGDVLFHILFIANIFKEKDMFDIEDVAGVVADKMVRRHPHVFGDKTVKSVDDVKNRWHKIKKTEKNGNNKKSVMDSVPRGVPALIRAYRLTERAARVGFDWPDLAGVMDKVKEEFAELDAAIAAGDSTATADELGDVIFSMVNLARFLKVHPDTALCDAVAKFEDRFRYMEKTLAKSGQTVEDVGLETLDALWNESKRGLK